MLICCGQDVKLHCKIVKQTYVSFFEQHVM